MNLRPQHRKNSKIKARPRVQYFMSHTSRPRVPRLQNSSHFCVFKYARAVKQKVWNEAENRERDWGETLKIRITGLQRQDSKPSADNNTRYSPSKSITECINFIKRAGL